MLNILVCVSQMAQMGTDERLRYKEQEASFRMQDPGFRFQGLRSKGEEA
jgi:hypothetical protein